MRDRCTAIVLLAVAIVPMASLGGCTCRGNERPASGTANVDARSESTGSEPSSRPASTVAPARLTENEKIEHLISHIAGLESAVFIRNRREHDCREAADHMRSKWKWKRNEIRTARDFIRLAATGSTVSGEPYFIRWASGKQRESAAYLTEQLERLEREGPASAAP